jgi:hypothetical protein
MKTIKFIILFLAILMTNSCSKDETGITPKFIDEEIIVEGIPFREHLLWLGFQDASGNNLLKGIGYDIWKDGEYVTATKEDPESGIIKPELYTLEYIYPDGIPNPWKPGPAPMINVDGVWIPTYILDERHPEIYLNSKNELQLYGKNRSEYYEYLEQQLSGEYLEQQLSDDTYLWFNTKSHRDSEFPEQITIRLTCSYLFGDNEAHDIITWWKPVATFQTSCYRVEFEGKGYEMSGINGATVATIILDK